MHIPHRLGAGLLAGSLLFTGAAGVMAAPAHVAARPVPFFAAGQVSNLSATGFTLTRLSRQGAAPVMLQVTLAATTKEVARKGTTGMLADADYVVVAGTRSATGITARRILYSSTRFRAGRIIQRLRARVVHRVAGNVSAFTTTSLAIQTKAGKTFIFTVDAATKVNGQVAQGERVVVRFVRIKPAATTAAAAPAVTLVARAIMVRPAKAAQP